MTRRAFFIGLLMASWVNLWPAYSSLILHSSRADYANLSVALLIPFLCLLALNLALERRGGGLSASELLVICCMGMVAALMQGEWLSGYFLGVITAPAYFATPENRWGELLLERMPAWSIVADRTATIGFYESLHRGGAIPWDAWVAPLFWWGGFLGAVLLGNFCLTVILRKQWMENERLAFPIATALLELTGVSGSKGTLSALLRSRLFRIGFWVVFGILAWNIVSWFVTGMPPMPVLNGNASRKVIPIARGFPSFRFAVSLLTIVFGYFTRSDVLFSIWSFHLLAILQAGIFNRLGLSIGGSDPWCSFHPAVGWQNFGGMAAFVGWGLWIGRAHLKAVFRKAFTGKGDADDTGELLSYRTAVCLLLGCGVYVALYLHRAGMGWGPIAAFWFATLVLYLGLTRIVVESGLVFMRGPITAQAFTWHLFGIAGMGPASAIALGLTYTFFCDAKTFGITTLAHIPRLGVAIDPRRRRGLVSAVMLATLVGAATVVGFTLYQGYHAVGSYNFGVVSFNGSGDGAVGIWRVTANRIQQGTFGTDWNRIGFLGIGAAFTCILLYLRYRFPGFPLHPIGFTISASAVLRNIAASTFLVWLIKGLLMKFGGLERYHRTTPFFLGMMVGYLTGVAFGIVVDAIWFPGNGHELHVSF